MCGPIVVNNTIQEINSTKMRRMRPAHIFHWYRPLTLPPPPLLAIIVTNLAIFQPIIIPLTNSRPISRTRNTALADSAQKLLGIPQEHQCGLDRVLATHM